MDRNNAIIKVSIKGIAVNVILVIFKAIVGLMANSVAVILDAVNNLSDALSSAITIIGTKIAGRAADKKHPYGHGRVEYITASVIAVIVLATGITSLKESIVKIIHPEQTAYTSVTLIVITSAIAAKLLLGKYFSKKGKELNSSSLSASGADASFDAVISAATLVSAIINLRFGLNLEGWLGAIISIFILKTGIEIIVDALSSIIGVRIEDELSLGIKETLNRHKEVLGSYDLILHSYGPQENIGSVHIEVRDDMTAKELDELSRELFHEVYLKYGVVLTIGVYATNTDDDTATKIKDAVRQIISEYEQVLQMHGFYIDKEKKFVTFDIIIDFSEEDKIGILNEIKGSLKKDYPEYEFNINLDRDFSE